METSLKKVFCFGEAFASVMWNLFLQNKVLFWGMIAPVVAGLIFWSISAGVSVALFASAMFTINNKEREAKEVLITLGILSGGLLSIPLIGIILSLFTEILRG